MHGLTMECIAYLHGFTASGSIQQSADHRDDGQLIASCYLCVFFEFIEHIPNENPNDDTSIGLHRRVAHFLPCLLVKTHDNDDGKNMHETNVDANGRSLDYIAYLHGFTASVCFQRIAKADGPH